MYKTEHAVSYLLLKLSVANYVINVLLFAESVCCESRRRRVEASSSASVDAEGGHFEHYL